MIKNIVFLAVIGLAGYGLYTSDSLRNEIAEQANKWIDEYIASDGFEIRQLKSISSNEINQALKMAMTSLDHDEFTVVEQMAENHDLILDFADQWCDNDRPHPVLTDENKALVCSRIGKITDIKVVKPN